MRSRKLLNKQEASSFLHNYKMQIDSVFAFTSQLRHEILLSAMLEIKKSKRNDLTFCRVPKIIKNQGEETEILSAERRRRWLTAISRDDLTDKILEYDRVCGEHFHSGKAAPLG